MSKKHFKSSALFSTVAKSNVDKEKGIIRDIVIVQGGIDKEGGYFDDDFLKGLIEEGNAQKMGVKSRFGHPNMCSTTLGTYIGRYKNFRVREGDTKKVVADLHLDPITKKTQVEGKGIAMWDYILEMAASNPDMFGNSIHFTAQTEDGTVQGKSVEKYDLKTFIASDLVDSPAATNSLFKSSSDFGVIATQFFNENPEIFELLQKDNSIVETFIKRYKNYLSNSKTSDMGILSRIQKIIGNSKNLDLTLADGRIVVVLTDGETAQVGDEVTDEEGKKLEDGSYTLADGSDMVVTGNRISEIKKPDKADKPDKANQKEDRAAQKIKDLTETIEDLTKTVEFLAEKYADLENKHLTLARSVKSKDYEAPPAEDTGRKPKEDLYSRIKEKLNTK